MEAQEGSMEIDLSALPEGASEGALALLSDARAQGWELHRSDARRWRIWCPCPPEGKTHQTWIDLNPTSITYYTDTRHRLQTHTCWEEQA